ncbi:MAG: hypothetical protein M0R17_05120 [Candidatus Omnitrophica bacterium]|jgi:uncharacterized protein YdhG (YjbR/CyaY superfamily)|nr:hypothetical protein [Candidatus Omnitrophota bacterium]
MKTIYTTAATIRAILCYTNPEMTPKIAYDKDSYTEQINKLLLDSVGDLDGSLKRQLHLPDDPEFKRQLNGICDNISHIFKRIAELTET